jgi:hypothetical protein
MWFFIFILNLVSSLITTTFIFSLNIAEALIKALLRPRRKTNGFRAYSPEQQVLYLEWLRVSKGYKEGWLYYRCQEMGLASVLDSMQATGAIETYRRHLQEQKRSRASLFWSKFRSKV